MPQASPRWDQLRKILSKSKDGLGLHAMTNRLLCAVGQIWVPGGSLLAKLDSKTSRSFIV